MTDLKGFQRVEVDGLIIEFELDSAEVIGVGDVLRAPVAIDGPGRVDEEIQRLVEQIGAVDKQMDGLTNTSDGLDYSMAAACGVLAGIVDAVWVGEFSLMRAHEWGAEHVNEFVIRTAQRLTGYEGDDLATAILRLEREFPFAGDKATDLFGGPTIHHLRDLTHHPSPVGLVASIAMQFTGQAWGLTTNGSLGPVDVGEVAPKLIGKTVPEKLLFGTVYWFFHLVSDIAGSHNFAGAGTGLPGPMLSLVHEVSVGLAMLRGESDRTEFLKRVEGVFRGPPDGVPFDFRTELGIANEVGRQALPVLLNEALVRGVFFIRRAAQALHDAKPRTFEELATVDLRPALPWRNRSVTRMLTIASATFTAVDLLDASIRAAVASRGYAPLFTAKLLLRVNFVGVARTSIAIGVDAHQGMKLSTLRNERISLMNQHLLLLNARTSYRVDDVWVSADEADAAVRAADEAIALAGPAFMNIWAATRHTTTELQQRIDGLRITNPTLVERALDDLEWGVE